MNIPAFLKALGIMHWMSDGAVANSNLALMLNIGTLGCVPATLVIGLIIIANRKKEPRGIRELQQPGVSFLNELDASSFQQTIDWKKVAATGVSFTYIKATEGTTIQDPFFASNRANAKAAGIIVGAYHLFRPKTTTTAAVPLLPRPWNDWKFWQHNWKGIVSGITGNCDLDYFQGTLAVSLPV